MKQIPLTQGKFALVDDADFDWLNQWKWHYSHGYAVRKQWTFTNGVRNGAMVWMHREVIKTPDGMQTDHIDMNKLNNSRLNLRHATREQNNRNRPANKGSSSRFKGVAWHKQRCKWVANIRINGVNKYLGIFESELLAAQAYNAIAAKNHGEFSRLNII